MAISHCVPCACEWQLPDEPIDRFPLSLPAVAWQDISSIFEHVYVPFVPRLDKSEDVPARQRKRKFQSLHPAIPQFSLGGDFSGGWHDGVNDLNGLQS